MNQNLPKSLVWVAAFFAVSAFATAMYLEAKKSPWLEEHPISANLISAFICFNIGILFLAWILRWFVEREKIRELHAPMDAEWTELAHAHRPAWDAVVTSEVRDEFRRRGASTREIDPDGPSDCVPHKNARIALRIFTQSPPGDSEWQEAAGRFRSSAIEFLDAASQFSIRYEIDDSVTLTKLADLRTLIADLSEVDINANEYRKYLASRARLQALIPSIARTHWGMMRERVKSRR